LHAAVTGLPTTPDDLHAAAARIAEIKKRFNLAQGWTRALDTLPARLFAIDGEGPAIDPAWLERQITAYYAARGWDAGGRPPETERVLG
jgi:aldehyde:ferredoxin oxidoreductase